MLVRQGTTVKAILKFNEIAKDYPGTKWEKNAGEKVAELEEALKEGEAKKEFLEAQDLERKNNFIEATQQYQSIINRYPGTVWAEKSEAEIAKLKERQARLKERTIGPGEGGEREGPPFRFREEIDNLVRSDKEIMHFMIDEDSKGLTKYFLEKYPDRVKTWAEEAGLSAETFALDFSKKMIEGMKRDLARPREGPPQMIEESKPKFKPRFMEEVEKVIADMKANDPNIEKLINRGDEQKLAEYMWLRHEFDLKKIAAAMKIPGGRIGQPFALKVTRYLMKQDTTAFKMEPEERKERDLRGGPREMGDRELRDRLFNKFRELVISDERVITYIERGEVESLTSYVMDNYYDELETMSQEMDRPLRDLAWELSDRLVYEEREQR